MSALSIRAKVIAVIAFMLIAMSGMGLLAIRSMQVINAHTVEIASSWLPSVRVLGELRADINLFRIALRAHVMAETLERRPPTTRDWPASSKGSRRIARLTSR
jgi:hypothetical protein